MLGRELKDAYTYVRISKVHTSYVAVRVDCECTGSTHANTNFLFYMHTVLYI
jgi:hypothetical protein